MRIRALTIVLLLAFTIGVRADEPVRLIVRGDDMGAAQSINEACIKSYRDGIVRSVEVIAPGPWFLDAVRMIRENPGVDVGVHLCLTSEWERCKWRPLTRGATLVDEDGYFFPATSQRKDFPPNTGFLQAKPKPEEVEAELRAQIEMLKRHLPGRVSHVSSHMGAATSTAELKALTIKLAKEYSLRFEGDGVKPAGNVGNVAPEAREGRLVQLLEGLKAGTYVLVEHPGLDTPELQAFGHLGNYRVGADRAAITATLTSERVNAAVKAKSLRLIGYKDIDQK